MTPILIIEDEPLISRSLHLQLKLVGYTQTRVVDCAEDAIRIIDRESMGIVLLDYYIKGSSNGFECAQMIRKTQPQLPIVFMTAQSDKSVIANLETFDRSVIVPKPFVFSDIQSSIEQLLAATEPTT